MIEDFAELSIGILFVLSKYLCGGT